MNDTSIQLVRETFDLVEPIAPQAAALFYANLFAADPSLATLFKGDMMVQGHRMTQMLAPAVSKLDVLAILQTALILIGWGLAQYPLVLAPDLGIEPCAAPRIVLVTTLTVLGIGTVLLVPAFVWLYRVFKTG